MGGYQFTYALCISTPVNSTCKPTGGILRPLNCINEHLSDATRQ